MTNEERAALLDLITEKAPKMRAAGIGQASIDGVSFVLLELGATAAAGEPPDEPEDDLNPLSDPATFGIRAKKGQQNAPLPSRGGGKS